MGLVVDSSLFIGAERKTFDLAAFFTAHSDDTPYRAAITAAELLHGVERATPEYRAIRSLRVEQYLAAVEVIDFDLAVARRYAALWAAMEAAGNKTTIGFDEVFVAPVWASRGSPLSRD